METNHKEFKPFDKVLIKPSKFDGWRCDLYSHYDEENENHETFKGYMIQDQDIISFEGNEHLIGTTDKPDEEVMLKPGEWVMVTDYNDFSQYGWALRNFMAIQNSTNSFLARASEDIPFRWDYAIRFSNFNPNDMEETRKHILCVKNGKVVKYKD